MTLPSRINYLDGLRGILAVIVFFHHFFYAFYPEVIFGGNMQEFVNTSGFSLKRFIALTPVNIFLNPGMAIIFFFLLSGYVQTKTYFDKNDIIFLQRSFIKRYFRLAIPTVSVLLLVYSFHKLRYIHNDHFPVNELSNDWAKSLLPDNFGFFNMIYHGVFECFMGNSRYYQILWTMPIELLNSYIVLMLALATHNVKNRTWLFLAWLFVQLFMLHSYNGAAFTVGMLSAFYQKRPGSFNKFLSGSITKALCWVLGIYFASYPYTGYENSVQHSVYKPIAFFEVYSHLLSYLVGVTLIFCALSQSVRAQRVLSHKVFIFFGNISFMFYLVHFLLLFSFSPWLYHILQSSTSFSVNMLITGLSSLALITVISYVLFRFVDKPTIRLCNDYTKKIFGI